MTISSISSSGQSQSIQQTGSRDTLTQEDFLNLLITQMRNQNPLEPMDNNQMATQMVQFGSLDALNNMQKSLEDLTTYQASLGNLQVASLIGKKVEVEGGRLFIDKGTVSESNYQLSKPGKVSIQIYDSTGYLVRSIEEGIKGITPQKLAWDGKNQQGIAVPDGTYRFRVSAVDEKGQPITSISRTIATITGISFENGITYLKLGSEKITLGEIRAILG